MAKRRVYEGTWAEISAHAEELQNYAKLTLIVPDAESAPEDTGIILAEALKGYIGTSSFGDANLSEDTGKKFDRLLAEKYEKEQQ